MSVGFIGSNFMRDSLSTAFVTRAHRSLRVRVPPTLPDGHAITVDGGEALELGLFRDVLADDDVLPLPVAHVLVSVAGLHFWSRFLDRLEARGLRDAVREGGGRGRSAAAAVVTVFGIVARQVVSFAGRQAEILHEDAIDFGEVFFFAVTGVRHRFFS